MTVHATWKDGHVVIDEAVDWPDGCQLEVRPMSVNGSGDDEDDVLAKDRAAITRWIAEFDAIPPLTMSDDEAAEWQAARRAQREFELSTFEQRARKIQESLP